MFPATPIASTLRLFIGLWPEDDVRDALAAHQSAWTWPPGAATVAPAKLHLTLHFLGAVEAAAVTPLQQALDGVAGPALELPWAGAERWGGGLAVLRTRPDPRLDVLHAQLGERLRALGLPVEARPHKPHVTLARKAAGATPAAQLPALPWRSRGFVLVRSVAGRYEVLSRHG